MKDRKWEEGQEGDQLGDPKGSCQTLMWKSTGSVLEPTSRFMR